MTCRRLLAASLAALTATGAATACSTESRDTTPARYPRTISSHAASEQDRAWMDGAHQSNLTEINAGHLAMDKGTSSEIRSLGELLVREHTDLDRRLTAAARQLGVNLSQAPSSRQTQTLDALKKRSGREFDISWLTAMAPAHEEAISKTKIEISKGTAHAATTAAKNALPVLEKHLARIKVAKNQ